MLLAPIILVELLITLFKTPISVFKIIQKAKTNPSLLEYLAIKLTQNESTENFNDINENLELISNFPELLNYIQSKISPEKSKEEIRKI